MSNDQNPYAPSQGTGQPAARQYGQVPQYGQAPQYGQVPPYGQEPQYGQQAPQYGAPAAPQYGEAPQQGQQAPQYGASAYGAQPAHGRAPGWPGVGGRALASWPYRVGASLIDGVVSSIVPALCYGIAAGTSETTVDAFGTPTSTPTALGTVLILVGIVAQFAIWFWNRVWRQGRTGQSVGKSLLNIRLVKEATGGPAGIGLTFGREFAHILDAFFYIGYLWPLWDEKKQTFADKLCGTVVTRD
jgi:uncharacterized RDD family membrane protein YckC